MLPLRVAIAVGGFLLLLGLVAMMCVSLPFAGGVVLGALILTVFSPSIVAALLTWVAKAFFKVALQVRGPGFLSCDMFSLEMANGTCLHVETPRVVVKNGTCTVHTAHVHVAVAVGTPTASGVHTPSVSPAPVPSSPAARARRRKSPSEFTKFFVRNILQRLYIHIDSMDLSVRVGDLTLDVGVVRGLHYALASAIPSDHNPVLSALSTTTTTPSAAAAAASAPWKELVLECEASFKCLGVRVASGTTGVRVALQPTLWPRGGMRVALLPTVLTADGDGLRRTVERIHARAAGVRVVGGLGVDASSSPSGGAGLVPPSAVATPVRPSPSSPASPSSPSPPASPPPPFDPFARLPLLCAFLPASMQLHAPLVRLQLQSLLPAPAWDTVTLCAQGLRVDAVSELEGTVAARASLDVAEVNACTFAVLRVQGAAMEGEVGRGRSKVACALPTVHVAVDRTLLGALGVLAPGVGLGASAGEGVGEGVGGGLRVKAGAVAADPASPATSSPLLSTVLPVSSVVSTASTTTTSSSTSRSTTTATTATPRLFNVVGTHSGSLQLGLISVSLVHPRHIDGRALLTVSLATLRVDATTTDAPDPASLILTSGLLRVCALPPLPSRTPDRSDNVTGVEGEDAVLLGALHGPGHSFTDASAVVLDESVSGVCVASVTTADMRLAVTPGPGMQGVDVDVAVDGVTVIASNILDVLAEIVVDFFPTRTTASPAPPPRPSRARKAAAAAAASTSTPTSATTTTTVASSNPTSAEHTSTLPDAVTPSAVAPADLVADASSSAADTSGPPAPPAPAPSPPPQSSGSEAGVRVGRVRVAFANTRVAALALSPLQGPCVPLFFCSRLAFESDGEESLRATVSALGIWVLPGSSNHAAVLSFAGDAARAVLSLPAVAATATLGTSVLVDVTLPPVSVVWALHTHLCMLKLARSYALLGQKWAALLGAGSASHVGTGAVWAKAPATEEVETPSAHRSHDQQPQPQQQQQQHAPHGHKRAEPKKAFALSVRMPQMRVEVHVSTTTHMAIQLQGVEASIDHTGPAPSMRLLVAAGEWTVCGRALLGLEDVVVGGASSSLSATAWAEFTDSDTTSQRRVPSSSLQAYHLDARRVWFRLPNNFNLGDHLEQAKCMQKVLKDVHGMVESTAPSPPSARADLHVSIATVEFEFEDDSFERALYATALIQGDEVLEREKREALLLAELVARRAAMGASSSGSGSTTGNAGSGGGNSGSGGGSSGGGGDGDAAVPPALLAALQQKNASIFCQRVREFRNGARVPPLFSVRASRLSLALLDDAAFSGTHALTQRMQEMDPAPYPAGGLPFSLLLGSRCALGIAELTVQLRDFAWPCKGATAQFFFNKSGTL